VGRASWCAAGPSVHLPCDGNRHGDVGAQGGEVGDAPVAPASEEVDVNVGHVANVLKGPVAVAAVRAVVAVAWDTAAVSALPSPLSFHPRCKVRASGNGHEDRHGVEPNKSHQSS
jgi:hypothetical protein